jgi:hypothetical protein
MTGLRNYSACRADFVLAVDSSRRSSSSSSTNVIDGTLPSYSRHTRRTAASNRSSESITSRSRLHPNETLKACLQGLQGAQSSLSLPNEYKGKAGPDGKCGTFSYHCVPPCNMYKGQELTTNAVATNESPCSDTGELLNPTPTSPICGQWQQTFCPSGYGQSRDPNVKPFRF